MKTLQEAFNKMYVHLMTQKVRSEGIDGGCAYRGADGRQCAIGCLIEDEYYLPEIEGTTNQNGLVIFAIKLSGWDIDSKSLQVYTHMQDVHDRISPEDWQELLGELARIYELTIPEMENTL